MRVACHSRVSLAGPRAKLNLWRGAQIQTLPSHPDIWCAPLVLRRFGKRKVSVSSLVFGAVRPLQNLRFPEE